LFFLKFNLSSGSFSAERIGIPNRPFEPDLGNASVGMIFFGRLHLYVKRFFYLQFYFDISGFYDISLQL